jgi:hypothetical protein
MRFKFIATLLLLAALGLLVPGNARAADGELKLEATLVWGTNDKSSPDPNHKPVAADVEKKLKKLPFKWENYFEVNRQTFTVPKSGEKTIHMSKECDVTVKNLGNDQVELHLIGKNKPVGKITQELPKGKLLVTGGNAENFTSWFIVLKQTD